ncbi:hypothetical protein HDG34_003408 [Paraburkholderia sp. HC6.4b]|uniref:hypothetical protein n=1 Tax=unclassified Paraburkholderia TaxID=2615204 RepID=UPI001617AF98|nr:MULTISPECIES: hypothetical protein [unclassified Paraburkholderia]MBB5409466.1 hypothetical protein [Paraburkholderia sp. HC6.4b]MBB5451196.1 hypothetical protein [Paraburkholderia sp. Kb1A]
MARGGSNGKQSFRRIPLQSISFSDVRGEVKGFANSWFFWVHEAFKDALDIRFVERIDREKTAVLRERMSQESSGLPIAELRRRKEESAELKQTHQTVMKAARKQILETEAISPSCTFRATDSFESRCGKWYIQVTRENNEKIVGTGDDTKISHEELGVEIYRRSTDPATQWEKHSSAKLQQSELAQLLKTGKAGTFNLTADKADAVLPSQLLLF